MEGLAKGKRTAKAEHRSFLIKNFELLFIALVLEGVPQESGCHDGICRARCWLYLER